MHFFSSVENSYLREFSDPQNKTDPDNFSKLVRELIQKLSNRAAYNSSLIFATGRLLYRSDLPLMHGMVQCTRDLSRVGCNNCLEQVLVHLQNYLAGKRGGRVIGMGCYFRYEVYPFYEGEPTITLNTLLETEKGKRRHKFFQNKLGLSFQSKEIIQFSLCFFFQYKGGK